MSSAAFEIDPAIRPALEKLPRSNPRNPLVRGISALALRLLPARPAPGVTITTLRSGSVRGRIHTPDHRGEQPGAALLWIHGGGYVIGNSKIDDALCGETASELGIVVVSADYRLAPRHPFPAPLDDVSAVWDWLLEHASELGVDPARVAVGGQSAGGGLAAALAQRLHDRGGIRPAAQWLFCPMLDDRTAAKRELDEPEHPVWTNVENRFGWHAYLGRASADPEPPPYAVPARRRDLAGLPPAWLDAGSIELFRAEIEDYAARLEAAGVPARLDVVPNAPHGFETWALASAPAQEVRARARQWLSAQLA
ncbi:alpha/beta hydrolase [Leucobacter weissii]|uniref:Alpha/beta hydrolase n=1 Tax=Leucobacter weissii TaxID=1983706 RepID=A0A939MJC2_9MICO|nr:alpha/beta hydrolase [Leucobacter weissii]MBO1901310.1 alpha/beta hydrolase [Leucobacter weissii]